MMTTVTALTAWVRCSRICYIVDFGYVSMLMGMKIDRMSV
jgi:hypothetical protein